MNIERFAALLEADFYTGVPDSQLKALCSFLMDRYGLDPVHHIIAANEGNAVGLAAATTWPRARCRWCTCRTAAWGTS